MTTVARTDANERARQVAAMLRVRRELGIASRPRRLPRQVPPDAIARDYAAELLAIVQRVRAELRPLLDALPRLLARARSERLDQGEGENALAMIEAAQERLQRAIEPRAVRELAGRVAGRTGRHNREQLGQQVRAALGADIFLQDRQLAALVDGFVAENVALIKDVPDRILGDVAKAVTRGVQAGVRHEELAEEINGIFDFGEKRAKLIARDQTLKFYSAVNRARQQEMGADGYIWRTVNDRRVRPEHRPREGKRYSWDDPPSGGHPGEAVQCRCYAEPDFSDLLGDLLE